MNEEKDIGLYPVQMDISTMSVEHTTVVLVDVRVYRSKYAKQ